MELGRTRFESYCAACHEGQGLGQQAPPLASSWLSGSDGSLIRLVLQGLQGPIEVEGKTYNFAMPGFGELLSDREIAAVLTFVRRRYGDGPPVEAKTVRRVRAETRGRRMYWTVEELRALR